MNDIHQQQPRIHKRIDFAGIKNLKAQFKVLDQKFKTQKVTATVDFLCEVSEAHRGVHMSRFVEILNEWCFQNKEVSLDKLVDILEQCNKRLHSRLSTITARFDYFIFRKTPVSKMPTQVPVAVIFHASIFDGDPIRRLTVTIPVHSVCPCAGHQQRAEITVDVIYNEFVWIEEIAELVWETSSGSVYSLLKRKDEQFLVSEAIKRPMFVEDLVREVYAKLKSDPRISECSVTAESFESIHTHSAVARIGDVRRTITHLREEIW